MGETKERKVIGDDDDDDDGLDHSARTNSPASTYCSTTTVLLLFYYCSTTTVLLWLYYGSTLASLLSRTAFLNWRLAHSGVRPD